MKAPEYPSDISQDWVEFILNDYENKLQQQHQQQQQQQQDPVKVIINTFTIGNGLTAGEGFAGQLIKLDVEAKLTCENKSVQKEYHLMVKLMDFSATRREENKQSQTDIREMLMYKEVIPELNRFAMSHGGNEFCLSMPGIIYGKCTEYEFVLVMENLKHQGYDTLPNEKGHNYDQMLMNVEYLAKLHALSYSYDKKYNFLQKFPCYKNDVMTDIFFSFGKYEGLMNAKSVLKTMDGTEEFLKKIELAEPQLMKDYDEARRNVKPESILCLTHADLWNKNIMFKTAKNENGEEITEDGHILDWQRAFWNTSVFDLHFLIYSSTTKQLRKDHLEQLLQHYYSLFTTIVKKMGISLEWSYEDFQAEYKRLQVFGVLRGLTITQLTLSEQIKEYMENSTGGGAPYSFMKPIYYYWAKILFPIKYSRVFQSMFMIFFRYMFGNVGKEMLEKNPVMRERVIDIVYDADADGFFNQKIN